MKNLHWISPLLGSGSVAALASAVPFLLAVSNALAAVVVSSKATQNMNCSGGVCAPTAKDAVLNVGDLQTMLASGNVSVTTTAPGVQAKDIRVVAAFSWISGSTLALDAHQSLTIDQPVTVMGPAELTLTTNDGGKNGLLSFGKHGNVTFANLSSSLTIDGTAYELANSIASLAKDVAGDPSGAYALANSYDAGQDGIYTQSPIGGFSGSFEGLGNTIFNLTIDDPLDDGLGFFRGTDFGSRISDITLANASVTLEKALIYRNGAEVGVLAGNSAATITGVHATGSVRVLKKFMTAGGLVGGNFGPMSGDDAHVAVSGPAQTALGGLVGGNGGTIAESHADGSVKGGADLASGAAGGLVGVQGEGSIVNSYARGAAEGANYSGGLVGYYEGAGIVTSYSTGRVKASQYAGGLIGADEFQSGISDAYWDTETSGITNLSQGAGNVPNDPGITGLTTEQLQSGLPQGFDPEIWGQNPKINNGLPYLLADPPASGRE